MSLKPSTATKSSKVVLGADDADWDLCTGFVSSGKCARENCRWRHENGVWWEGAWWRDDGKGWDGNKAPIEAAQVPERRNAKKRPDGWWKTLPLGEECCVSLTPICELENEPFELTAASPLSDEVDAKDAPRHMFDAMALANFLVSSGHFINPVNRRTLDISECRALDRHLGKASLRVTDAFVLAGNGAARSMEAREVASMAHHLFRFPSVRDVREDATNGTGGSSGSTFAPLPRRAQEQMPSLPFRDSRKVHAEGGLRVIDDNESDSAGDELGADDFPSLSAAAPTPAEAAAASSAPKLRRAPRPPRGEQAAAAAALNGTCSNSASATCGAGKQASGEGGRRRGAAAARHDDSGGEENDRKLTVGGSNETWIPAWATPELQARQLAEVEDLLSLGSVSAEAKDLARLRGAVKRKELLKEGPGFRCETRTTPTAKSRGLVAVFTLPLFYPGMPLRVELCSAAVVDAGGDLGSVRGGGGGSSSSGGGGAGVEGRRKGRENAPKGETIELILALESVLRREVLEPVEGGRALEAGSTWLRSPAAQERLEHLRKEFAVRDEERERERQRAEAARVAAQADAAEEAVARSRVAEKQVAEIRKIEKFSPNWDLCSGFIKNGKCKNKNCKWRHEMPEKPAKVKEEPKEEKNAKPASGSKASKKNKR
eukprot:TRINITY_DN61969_c0_g1_i1.p1 TRINITY_DN61969_c0_g1~~TRINITY_DN61969_c0_g1_i1.p1  ORF type:complete len:660 (-),score=152.88 TRINITY_DN61969_c0_g1_i1:37-2016(-)